MTVEQVKAPKRPNAWMLFLKSYASENNVSYSSLLSDKKIKELYIASKTQPVLEVVPSLPDVVITEKVKKIKKEKKPKKVKVDKPKKEDLVAEVVV